MARVDIGASRLRKKRRMRMVRVAGLAILAAFIVVGLIAWSTWAPFWRIHTIEVRGTQTIATSTIEQFVKAELKGTRGFVFSKDNILIYPKQSLTAALLKNIPTLASAQVSAANFSTLTVAVSERQPKALWCGASAPEATSTDNAHCYLLDSYGAAYAPADIQGSAYERYYGSLSGSALPKQYLSSSQFQALAALIDALGSQSQETIVGIDVDQNSDVQVTYASGFQLLFSLNDAGGDVYERFRLALTAEPFKSKQLSDFEYLDLRFGDKLYYKVKNE